MSITIKQLNAYQLVIDDDPPITVRRLGKGRFTTAYQELSDASAVYLSVCEEDGDYSKRILMECDGPYFPKLEHLGTIEVKGRFSQATQEKEYEVYKTEFYQRLLAKHANAWSDYKALRAASDEALRNIHARHETNRYAMRWCDRGYDIMNRTIELLVYAKRGDLADVLETLKDAAMNYGSCYTFEFAPRNLGVRHGCDKPNCDRPEHAQLVLVDPIFSLETIERQRNEHRKRYEARHSRAMY